MEVHFRRCDLYASLPDRRQVGSAGRRGDRRHVLFYTERFPACVRLQKAFDDPGNIDERLLQSQSGQIISTAYPVLRRRIFVGYSQFCHGGSAQGGSEPVSFAKLGSVAGLLHVV